MADPRPDGGTPGGKEPPEAEVPSARAAGEAIVLVAHGSHTDARSSRPVLDHVDRLRDRGRFAEVRTAFWKGQPSLRSVLATVESEAATVVPMMTSEGYFVEEVFPRELRLDADPPHAPATVRYADPVGTHPVVTSVVERRARAAAADPAAAAVAVVGHGTDRNATSGISARTHADRLRRRGRFAAVGALYLDEEPGLGRLLDRFDAAECVVVPLFVADAGHVTDDVPAAVEGVDDASGSGGTIDGGPSGSAATADDGRRVRYAGAVGTAPSMADVAVARAVEAGADVDVEAGAVVDVEAGADVDVEAGAVVDVEAGADVDGTDVGSDEGANRSRTLGTAGRTLLRWLERADDLPAPARHALLRSDAGLCRTWGELLVTVAATPAGERRYEVRHVADAGAARGSLSRLPDPRALRDRARFDDDGRYRPLRSARSLPHGWVLPDLDGPELVIALDHVYPASVADWARERAGKLPVTHFRETAARQTGRYEPLTDLSAADLGCAVAACCSGCVRQRRWEVAPDEPVPGRGAASRGPDDDADGAGQDAADEAAIPCREPCPVFLAAAREFALLERGGDPDGELGRLGERYRARYRRAKRSRGRAEGAREAAVEREGRA